MSVDKTSCEFALVVSDRWQSHGLGHHLMQNLMEVARDRGLDRMEGQILSENAKMLDLVTSLGFRISNDPEDPAVKQAVAELHK